MARGNPVPALIGAGVVVAVGVVASVVMFAIGPRSNEPPAIQSEPVSSAEPSSAETSIAGLFQTHCLSTGAHRDAVIAAAQAAGFQLEPMDPQSSGRLVNLSRPIGGVQKVISSLEPDPSVGDVPVRSQRTCLVSDLSQGGPNATLDLPITGGLTPDGLGDTVVYRFAGAGAGRRDLGRASREELIAALAAGEVQEIFWLKSQGLAGYVVSSGAGPMDDVRVDFSPSAAPSTTAAPAVAPIPAVKAPDTAELFLDICVAHRGRPVDAKAEAGRRGFVPVPSAGPESESMVLQQSPQARDFVLLTVNRDTSRQTSCRVRGPASGAAGRAKLRELMAPTVLPRRGGDGGDEYTYRDGITVGSVDLGTVSERRLMEIWRNNDIRIMGVDSDGAAYRYITKFAVRD